MEVRGNKGRIIRELREGAFLYRGKVESKIIIYAKRFIKEGKGKTPKEIAPGTKVYELVEELAKYLPEEQRRHFMG